MTGGHDSGLDIEALARIDVAYQSEFDRWQMQIDALWADGSLTPYRRAAAIASLRQRQRGEANEARHRAVIEEGQKAAAARRKRGQLLHPPPQPS